MQKRNYDLVGGRDVYDVTPLPGRGYRVVKVYSGGSPRDFFQLKDVRDFARRKNLQLREVNS